MGQDRPGGADRTEPHLEIAIGPFLCAGRQFSSYSLEFCRNSAGCHSKRQMSSHRSACCVLLLFFARGEDSTGTTITAGTNLMGENNPYLSMIATSALAFLVGAMTWLYLSRVGSDAEDDSVDDEFSSLLQATSDQPSSDATKPASETEIQTESVRQGSLIHLSAGKTAENKIDRNLLEGMTAKQRKDFISMLRQVDYDAISEHLWTGDSVAKYVMRFFKARKCSVARALAMLKTDLAWREKHRWKEAVLTKKPLDLIGLSAEQLQALLPIWHQGYCKNGAPLSIQIFGAVRLPSLLAATTLDNICAFQSHHSEGLARLCSEKNVDKWVIIIDAASSDPRSFFAQGAFGWARSMNDIDANHNPERLGSMLIINAPKVQLTADGLLFISRFLLPTFESFPLILYMCISN